jgi:ribosomal protein S27E
MSAASIGNAMPVRTRGGSVLRLRRFRCPACQRCGTVVHDVETTEIRCACGALAEPSHGPDDDD